VSTAHIDEVLRKKAEKELDAGIQEAVGAFTSALVRMSDKSRVKYSDVRSMALNLLLKESWTRKHFVGEMDEEAEHGKGRANAISGIHERLAREFIAKLDGLSEEVEELRDSVAWHDHD